MGNPLLNAPAVMIGSLTIAILFAVGHHLFYWSLQRPGQVVPTSTFSQGINTSAGTAFAFLVKAALTVALGTAYTQLLFDTLFKNTLSVEITDILTGMLASAIQMCRLDLIWRYPRVLLLALIYHLIAISTIVPPGTLSITLRTMNNAADLLVPDLNWNFIKATPSLTYYGNTVGDYPDTTTVLHLTSDLDISNIVSLTVLNNRIPLLPAFASNSSYELDVIGPAIQCLTRDYHSRPLLKQWRPYCPSGLQDLDWVGYMAWIPNTAHFNGSFYPVATVNNTVFPVYLNSSVTGYNKTQQVDCKGIAGTAQILSSTDFIDPNFELDIAMATGGAPNYGGLVVDQTPDVSWSWTWTRCTLANATYQILFNFSDVGQIVTVKNRTITDLQKTIYTTDNPDLGDGNFGRLYNNASFNYINLMNSFSAMIAGVIDESAAQTATPQIFKSNTFTSTNEFQAFLNTFSYSKFTFGTSNSTGALAPFLEELFTNVTVALFTQGQQGLTTAQASVTTWGMVQVYNYSWQHLVLSYGVGIAVTLLAIAYGCSIVAMRKGASYNLAFSTFLRITPWKDVSDLLAATNERHVGANPVPPALAATKLRLGKVSATEFELVEKPPASVNVAVTETSSMLSAPSADDRSTEPLRSTIEHED
ncbi:hypothetical protein MBLNU457_7714t1 [Dothideomycetes sp. NU457]